MTGAFRDEKIQQLYERHGMAGIGRWWVLVEAVAEHMDESDKCELSYTKARWAKVLAIPSPTALATWLATVSSIGLIELHQHGDQLCCSIPNLLKIRARKKPIENKKNTQNRIEVENRIRTPIVPKGLGDEFESFWVKYPKRNGIKPNRKKAEDEWKKLNTEEKAKASVQIIKQVQHYESCKKSGKFVSEFPDAFRWLRDKKFNDEIEMTLLNGSGSQTSQWVKDWSCLMSLLASGYDPGEMRDISEIGRNVVKHIGGIQTISNCPQEKLPELKNIFRNNYFAMENQKGNH